jgi:predicted RNA-binding protein (virulence factor B family)
MITAGQFHTLTVLRIKDFGAYLGSAKSDSEILLPKRFVPRGLRQGDEVEVFVYHDSEDRLIATTQRPFGQVGDIVSLKCVGTSRVGAFLDWGLMKDLFVPVSQQADHMREGGTYLVMIYLDEQTGRVAATQKFEKLLSNQELFVTEGEVVDLTVFRQTDLGYMMIINNQHLGLLHFNEVYRNLEPGDKMKGHVKTIRPDNKIDVVIGQQGYKNRVEDESGKILRLLRENDGYLPFHDKSDPDEIYSFFGMSKKTFKMTTGALYKQQKISLTQTGILLLDEGKEEGEDTTTVA